ncbi:lysine transporter LysE [Microbulbifer sp. A4B17]|uniref:LysE family translocator n=1 Tax=Microbulbifer sp. A4B17 TaxID=359370 RepID=UPI000D52BAFE|nr:LysE family translocator [Microbulbifer sp. A4B17]AWF81174.1 lysine transporter LysE [Microbulbifer sp. A4B17]
MSFESWLAFCSIALLATVTPGPAVLLVSINTLSAGVRGGVFTALGNICGLFVMSGLSVIGLSALVLNSSVAFTVVKVIGAAYLVYTGFKLWRNGIGKMNSTEVSCNASRGMMSLYVQGVSIALTNPKAIIFTTALFPQFISLSSPLLPQFSLLVFSFMVISFSCLFCYALLAQGTKAKSKGLASSRVTSRILGSTFVGAGCILAGTSK